VEQDSISDLQAGDDAFKAGNASRSWSVARSVAAGMVAIACDCDCTIAITRQGSAVLAGLRLREAQKSRLSSRCRDAPMQLVDHAKVGQLFLAPLSKTPLRAAASC
jgi:hypothetical protein